MYPRISSGSPLDPWRRVQGDVERSQKACRSIFLPKRCQKTNSAAAELKPMYADAEDPQLYREVGYLLRYLCSPSSVFFSSPIPSFQISSHLISPDLTASQFILSHLTTPRHISSHLISGKEAEEE